MTCSLFDENLDDLIDIANDTPKQKSIAIYANSLTGTTVGTCSDDELSNLEADKEALEAIVTDYETELYTKAFSTIISDSERKSKTTSSSTVLVVSAE